ncbi:MAG: hypothetical protein M1120_03680 [Patescibacteria group bacterium]|nr:hypothetical protein [Patescibacteria group bacterium]
MRIGIDIDDVIAKTGQIFYQRINERFGLNIDFTKVPSYDYVDKKVFEKGYTPHEFYDYLTKLQLTSTYHNELDSRRYLRDILKRFYKKGHLLYLVSNRHVLILPYTLVWLKKTGILPYLSGVIHNSYTQKPYAAFKVREAKRLKLDLFLEDALDYALPIAQSGIPVILFDRPWNQSAGLPKNVYRVDGWKQAEEIMKQLARDKKHDKKK